MQNYINNINLEPYSSSIHTYWTVVAWDYNCIHTQTYLYPGVPYCTHVQKGQSMWFCWNDCWGKVNFFNFTADKWWKLYELQTSALILVFGFKIFWKAAVFLIESGRLLRVKPSHILLLPRDKRSRFSSYSFLTKLLVCIRKKKLYSFIEICGGSKINHCIIFLLVTFSGNIHLRVDLLIFQRFGQPSKIFTKMLLGLKKNLLNLKLEISMD